LKKVNLNDMMRLVLLLILLPFSLSSCSIREREKQLERKLAEIEQREQQLLLKEKLLALREGELAKKERAFDSTAAVGRKDSLVVADSTFVRDTTLIGNWSVRMHCTETNCTGSAVGDTKTETWELNYQDNSIIAKANADGKLVRIYIGRHQNNRLQLTARHDENDQTTRMVVDVQRSARDEMRGTREIFRPDGCRIVYELELKKV
jgi:hypothetical protein